MLVSRVCSKALSLCVWLLRWKDNFLPKSFETTLTSSCERQTQKPIMSGHKRDKRALSRRVWMAAKIVWWYSFSKTSDFCFQVCCCSLLCRHLNRRTVSSKERERRSMWEAVGVMNGPPWHLRWPGEQIWPHLSSPMHYVPTLYTPHPPRVFCLKAVTREREKGKRE